MTEDVELQAYLNEVSLNGTGPNGGLGRVNMSTNHKTSTRIGIFLNLQLFNSGFGFRPHTYPANPDRFESALQSRKQ